MSTLALTYRPVDSRSIGYDIRVVNLCAQLPGEVHLLVVTLMHSTTQPQSLATDHVFSSSHSTELIEPTGPTPLRHLRGSDDNFLRRSSPRQFQDVCRQVRALADRHRVEQVIAFGTDMAEVAAALPELPAVVDVCDSKSLTVRRRTEHSDQSARQRLKTRVDLARIESTEKRLPRRFRYVTTVSEPDTAQVRKLSGGAANVLTIPNGVDDALLGPLLPRSDERRVVFWGNLAFEPNQDALRFYLDHVHPRLGSADVHLSVVGPNAPDWLTERAAGDDRVVLTGYVDDLRSALAPAAVMVNPMRIGSGLKNKVLEAFALGIPVVSTRRGVEAVQPVQDGRDLRVADDPAGFADAVLDLLDQPQRRDAMRSAARDLVDRRYRWDIIGESWRDLVTNDGAFPRG